MATAPVEAIADAEAFGAYLEKSETVLVVMDVHQNWCGPCDTMKPTYNSIFNEIDNCEDKVAFTTADIKTLTPQLVALMDARAPYTCVAKSRCEMYALSLENLHKITTKLTLAEKAAMAAKISEVEAVRAAEQASATAAQDEIAKKVESLEQESRGLHSPECY